ncbi:hypothetical protein QL285_068827 [Trifolium repens]|nr:hypothetical protein QL285_068827 [Trifolium repens]
MVVAALPLLLHFCRELLVYGLMTSKKENIQKKIKNKGMETCSKRRHGHRCHVRYIHNSKTRNDRIFNNKIVLVEEVVDSVKRLSWLWFLQICEDSVSIF